MRMPIILPTGDHHIEEHAVDWTATYVHLSIPRW